jgi:phosphonopyruvate decarboxylase
MRSRAEAIRYVMNKHGPGALYVASTGYVARAVHELAEPDHHVFYMQGSMGLAPAIGLGIALHSTRPVVVINGDGALLMALGCTHTLRDHAPENLFHYVLDNGAHESVGGQPCAPLERSYPGVTEILEVKLGGRPARVEVEPATNTQVIREVLMSEVRDQRPLASD